MVEYERHRNILCMDSKYDTHNYKNDFYDERYKSYRSSRNDELKYSNKLSRSNYSDNIYPYRSRSRTRSRSRDRYVKGKCSRRERSGVRYSKPYNKSNVYFKKDEDSRSSPRYSKYDREHSSRSPLYRNGNKKLKNCTFDQAKVLNSKNMNDKKFVDREFSIKRSSRNDKENRLEYINSKLINDNCNDYNKKSLLGDGPKDLRIHLPDSEETKCCRKMCEETVTLMNLQCEQLPILNREYKSPNSVLDGGNLDNENSIQIIDYNHQKDISFITSAPLNSPKTLLESQNLDEEAPSSVKSFDQLISNSYDSESVLNIDEHFDNQIKSLADLLTTPVDNEVKWKLIPLIVPLRSKISEKDININSCSEYDPRISHIVQHYF